jgi:flagellin-like hook-associated protein FlgL
MGIPYINQANHMIQTFQSQQKGVVTLNESISTGKKDQSKNAASFGQSVQIRSNLASLNPSVDNARVAGTIVNIANNNIRGILDLMYQMKGYATSAVNDSLDVNSRTASFDAYNTLFNRLASAIQGAVFQTTQLFGSAAGTTLTFQTGQDGVVANTYNYTTIDLTNGGTSTTYYDGANINVGTSSLTAPLFVGQFDTTANAALLETSIGNMITALSNLQAYLNATQSGLELTVDYLNEAINLSDTVVSTLTDFDVLKGTSDQTIFTSLAAQSQSSISSTFALSAKATALASQQIQKNTQA